MDDVDNTLDFIGRKSCGCVVAWSKATNDADEIGRQVAKWIKRGYSVERMTTEESRQQIVAKCPHTAQTLQERPSHGAQKV